jgi:hypothetical protein
MFHFRKKPLFYQFFDKKHVKSQTMHKIDTFIYFNGVKANTFILILRSFFGKDYQSKVYFFNSMNIQTKKMKNSVITNKKKKKCKRRK